MNSIINPAWFYWLNILDNISTVAIVMTILSGIGLTILVGISFVDDMFVETKKPIVVLSIIFSVFLLISIFVPDKNTLLEMKAAELATKENIDFTVESIKSIVDYIINAAKEMKG